MLRGKISKFSNFFANGIRKNANRFPYFDGNPGWNSFKTTNPSKTMLDNPQTPEISSKLNNPKNPCLLEFLQIYMNSI